MNEQDIRQQIVDDLDTNMMVEAGAGAGKTTILVSRIIHQLQAGYKPEEIVAITFTKKAAQELKSRIGSKVHDALENATDSCMKEKLKQSLYDLDRMQISTIHSFCYRLLSEQTFLAGMRMDMEMLEDDETESRKTAFFQQWCRTLDAGQINHLKQNFGEWNTMAIAQKAFRAICELPDDIELCFERQLLSKSLQDYKLRGEQARETLKSLVLEKLNAYTTKTCKSIDEAVEQGLFNKNMRGYLSCNGIKFVEDMEKVPAQIEKKAKERSIFNKRKVSISGNQFKDVDSLSDQCIRDFFQLFDCQQFLNELTAYRNALIMDFILPARAAYRQQGESRFLSNDRLLQKARDLVKNHADAKAFFQRKFRCIYVDEFQDTDHVQNDLIFELCSDGKGSLKSGSLFLVGDPKQSIYRFRGADLPLYFRTKERMSSTPGCAVYYLNNNFRSGAGVIDFVNRNNSKLLQHYQPMVCQSQEPAANRPENQISGVYIDWDPCKKDTEDTQKAQSKKDTNGQEGAKSQEAAKDNSNTGEHSLEEDCQRVAEIILTLVQNQTKVWDKDLKQHRHIRYDDFLVLCQTTTHMDEYLDKMLSKGIPVQLSGKADVSDVKAMYRFASIYRYLAYPYYKKAKEGAMQSVIGGTISDLNQKIAEERLSGIKADVKDMNGIAAALYLVRHLGYLLDVDKIGRNALLRIQAQLQQMVQTVSAEAGAHPQALADGFFAYLSTPVERELSLIPPSSASGSDAPGAVRFMNLHKAKGLQGRIVLVCKRNEDLVFKQGSLLDYDSETGNYKYYHSVTDAVDFPHDIYPAYILNSELCKKAEREELDEYRRLEYVEATRAMEAIIFLGNIEKSDEFSFKDYDWTDCKQIDSLLSTNAPTQENEQPKPLNLNVWQPEFSEEGYRDGVISISPSDLETYSAIAPEEDPQDHRPSGNLFGTVMHRAIELLIPGIRAGSPACNTAISQALLENAEVLKNAFGDEFDQTVSDYRDYLQKVLTTLVEDTALCTSIQNAREVATEYPFWLYASEADSPDMFRDLREMLTPKQQEHYLPNAPDRKVWITGKADLVLFEQDGSITIWDYKSDLNHGMGKEEFASVIEKRYGAQMLLYRHVFSKLFKLPIEKVHGQFYTIG